MLQYSGRATEGQTAEITEQGIMLGHQDDPVYGTTWKWDEGKSDVFLTTGDYPAVMGFDLGK